MNDYGLDGRAALVTGAASGIGRAVTERLSQAGMSVLAQANQAPQGVLSLLR